MKLTLNSDVSSSILRSNIIMMLNSCRGLLSTDVIHFECNQCKQDLPLNSDGLICLDVELNTDIGNVLNQLLESMLLEHKQKSEKCSFASMSINRNFGTPNCLLFSFPESYDTFLKCFKIDEFFFEIEMKITLIGSSKKSTFVLYKDQKSVDNSYTNFILQHFELSLNVNHDKKVSKVEVWQEPEVICIANAMIAEQEENTLLSSNIKEKENYILDKILTD